MLTNYHRWGLVAFTFGQIHWKFQKYPSLMQSFYIVLWYSPVTQTSSCNFYYYWCEFENWYFKVISAYHRDQWVKAVLDWLDDGPVPYMTNPATLSLLHQHTKTIFFYSVSYWTLSSLYGRRTFLIYILRCIINKSVDPNKSLSRVCDKLIPGRGKMSCFRGWTHFSVCRNCHRRTTRWPHGLLLGP